MSTALTITRASLSLADLVVVGSHDSAVTGAGYWIPDDGSSTFALPTFSPRIQWAPDSAYVTGRQFLASVLDQGTLALPVRVIAPDATTLVTRKSALETALHQAAYTVTITVDGYVIGSWNAFPSLVGWQTPTPRDRADLMARAVLQIPVNP
jgi:hypothetical protein